MPNEKVICALSSINEILIIVLDPIVSKITKF